VVEFCLGLRDWLELRFDRLSHLLRLRLIVGLLSFRHLNWLLSLGLQLPIRFSECTNGNRDIFNEVLEEGTRGVEVSRGCQSDLGYGTRGETRRLRKMISTERATNRLPRSHRKRFLDGRGVGPREVRDIAEGCRSRDHSNPSGGGEQGKVSTDGGLCLG